MPAELGALLQVPQRIVLTNVFTEKYPRQGLAPPPPHEPGRLPTTGNYLPLIHAQFVN